MTFDGWIDARDSASVEREWATLGARRVEVGQWSPRPLTIRPEGAALLAAQFLGGSPERFAWWVTDRYRTPNGWPSPTFEVRRQGSRSFLDRELELDRYDCTESWAIREETDGTRGVQHITLDCTWGELTREGGEGRSITIIRVFDRGTRRAVSIPLHHPAAWVVGEVDVSPLDLFAARTSFKLPWKAYDPDSLRGFFAHLTEDLDARLALCATWPGGVTKDEVIDDREYDFRVRRRIHRYESAPFSIELNELLDPDGKRDTGWLTFKLGGLPWGQTVEGRIDSTRDPVFGVEGWVDLTLPRVQLEATIARLRAVPGVEV
jgi:hypothetical protein